MLLFETPITQTGQQLGSPACNEELNRLLCAAVVSKNFRDILLTSPEVAVTTGYQGETFNLSDEDRSWLFSIHPANLVDLAANMVSYQNNIKQDSKVKLPIEPVPQLVRVN